MRKPQITRTSVAVVVMLGLSTLLTGCDKAISEPADPLIKPVKLLAVDDLSVAESDAFLARIDATYRAQLSFQVGGEIKQLLVKMGEEVSQGDVLVTLDPKDLQLALNAAQAQYSLAKTEWQRAKQLYEKNSSAPIAMISKKPNTKRRLPIGSKPKPISVTPKFTRLLMAWFLTPMSNPINW